MLFDRFIDAKDIFMHTFTPALYKAVGMFFVHQVISHLKFDLYICKVYGFITFLKPLSKIYASRSIYAWRSHISAMNHLKLPAFINNVLNTQILSHLCFAFIIMSEHYAVNIASLNILNHKMHFRNDIACRVYSAKLMMVIVNESSNICNMFI